MLCVILNCARRYTVSLIVPPGFGLCAFTFTGAVGTQPYVTTLGVEWDAGTGTAVDAANNAMSAYGSNFASETNGSLTLDRVSFYIGDDGPSGSVDSDLPPIAMTRTGSYPPTACSAIARKVTAFPGRRGRGRMFLPGVLSENEIDTDGTVLAARRTSLTTALNEFASDLVTGTNITALVLLHSSAPADPTPITGFAVSDLVGWIRGRIR